MPNFGKTGMVEVFEQMRGSGVRPSAMAANALITAKVGSIPIIS